MQSIWGRCPVGAEGVGRYPPQVPEGLIPEGGRPEGVVEVPRRGRGGQAGGGWVMPIASDPSNVGSVFGGQVSLNPEN